MQFNFVRVGYDELLWGAAWLRKATQDDIQSNGKTLGADENINEIGWDNKHAGLNVLVSKVRLIKFPRHFIRCLAQNL